MINCAIVIGAVAARSLRRSAGSRVRVFTMIYIRLMTPEQAATLKRLAQLAYDLQAFKPNLTAVEADRRIASLTAKLKLLDGPPHTL